MSQTPSPQPNILKIVSIGFGLALLGIGLFLGLYFGLTGVSALTRLLVSMCVPPLIIAVLVGVYALMTGRFSPEKTDTAA